LSFDGLGLRAALLRAVREQGYTVPTAVQARAIPAILTGRDVMAAAETGSGKTAAFTLPMLQRLMGVRSQSSRAVRALVMVPTRELASQVARSVQAYGAHVPFRCSPVVSGVEMPPQVAALRRGADIVVAMPRLLLDHARSGNIDLSQVGIVVFDEADRMLDMGGVHDVRRVLALMPARRQNLLFCTTFPNMVSAPTGQLLEDPELIEAGLVDGSLSEIGHSSGYRADRKGKTEQQGGLVQRGARSGTIVLPCTRHGTNRLAQKLDESSITADEPHDDMSQSAIGS
jgi:ATP-dependent RNA helicase RhlE